MSGPPAPRRAPYAVAAVAAVLVVLARLPGLGRPALFVFDEAYYVPDALDVLRTGVEGSAVSHPPLGKWMLAAGMWVAGTEPVGWRLVPLLAGGVVAACTLLAAWRATGSRVASAAAAALAALDGVAVTTGRLALLDGLLALWTTVALLGLVTVVRAPWDGRLRRRAAVLVGVALGAAVAVKWSAALLLPVAVGTFLALPDPVPPPPGAPPDPAHPRRSAALAVVVLPLVVYAALQVPFLVRFEDTAPARAACAAGDCEWSFGERAGALVRRHLDLVEYHRTLTPDLSFAAPSWTWPVAARPAVLYELDCAAARPGADGVCPEGGARDGRTTDEVVRVVAGPSPVLWVAALVALAVLVRRAVRGVEPLGWLLLAWCAALAVPWSVSGRVGYSFYAAPVVPALAVAVVLAARAPDGTRRRTGDAALGAVVGATALLAVLVWPALTALRPPSGWPAGLPWW